VVRAVADWWDAVELWLTQLPFGFQVVLAIVVVVPLCWAAAVGIDRLVERLAAVVEARVAARRAGRER
jgi:hypothetical protein